MNRLAIFALVPVLALAMSTARAQSPGATLHVTGTDATAACRPAQQKLRPLLAEFEARLAPADRARAEAAAADAAKRGRGRADGYGAYASAALLQGQAAPAAWAALQAAALEWTPRHAANA